jgi:hypothetical protein
MRADEPPSLLDGEQRPGPREARRIRVMGVAAAVVMGLVGAAMVLVGAMSSWHALRSGETVRKPLAIPLSMLVVGAPLLYWGCSAGRRAVNDQAVTYALENKPGQRWAAWGVVLFSASMLIGATLALLANIDVGPELGVFVAPLVMGLRHLRSRGST